MNLGMGVFKSADGGNTWQHMGLEATKTTHRIITHPTDSEVVYVGAMGDPFTPSNDRGLYKSTDGGLTWKQILFTNQRSGIADLVMDPENPNKLIAALYEHRRTPYSFTSGGPGSGLFITYDAGETWKRLTAADGLPAGELGRIGVAIAPSAPNRIYAKIEAQQNALFRSDDGGNRWYQINDNPRFTNNRAFYFQDLAVDSKDPNRLYNIYQPLSVSYDGGKSFDPVPMIPADETKGIHADFHAFWVNPEDPRHFIIGGDGGIGITRDHGKSWYFPETLPVAQFYHINVDNDRPYHVYGGMQDNGNWSGPGYTWKRGGIRTPYWQYLVGGDGFYISPDEKNSRFGYGTSQNGALYRYDRTSGYYSSIKPPNPDPETTLRFHWNAAFAKDPFEANGIYYGSQFVHKSPDQGANWEIISPDLTTNNPEHQRGDYGGLTLDLSGAETYNSLLAIAPSPVDKAVIWAGSDDGQLHLSQDGGNSWDNLTSRIKDMPHEGWIARIQASPHQAGSAWVVVNNYRRGDYQPYLFKTEDYGNRWEQLADGAQVQGYALSVVQDPKEPNLVFLGTENGLWVSIDEGQSWAQFKNGFPSVSTMDLKIQERESALIVGTFGRAIWVLDDLLTLREIAGNRLNPGLTALPMNEAVQVKGLYIQPPGNIWTGFHTTFEGENRVFQKVKIPFYLDRRISDTDTLIATIYDKDGKLIQTIPTQPGARGLNYLIWKMDEKSNSLPSPGPENEIRGIPVLPGTYKVVLTYGNEQDSSYVRVIPDPRFELAPEVDEQLYQYRKAVDEQVTALSVTMKRIDQKIGALDRLKQQLAEMGTGESPLPDMSQMVTQLTDLKAKGRTPRPNRQLGAWRTLDITASSKVQDARMIAMSRVRPISEQEYRMLGEAEKMVDNFRKQVDQFFEKEWPGFLRQLKHANINWLENLE